MKYLKLCLKTVTNRTFISMHFYTKILDCCFITLKEIIYQECLNISDVNNKLKLKLNIFDTTYNKMLY